MELALPLKCDNLPTHGRCLGAGDEGRVFTMQDGRTMKQMVLNNASRHEVRAHSAIYRGIQSHTPCVTPMYDRWRCDDAHMDPCSAAPSTKKRQRKGVVYAVMQHAAYGDLSHFITTHRKDPLFAEFMRSILFQILHALHVAQERLEMTHWDLHDENVLIHRTSAKTRVIRVHDRTWTVPTYGFCPMLYDFGFAYVGRPLPDRTPIERIWTRKIKKTLGVADFKPFSSGYDQVVLGAYVFNDLDEHKIAEPTLRAFLRRGIGPTKIMTRALNENSLRPVGVSSADLDAFAPLDGMRHDFFASFAAAPRAPRAPRARKKKRSRAAPVRGSSPTHHYNLRSRTKRREKKRNRLERNDVKKRDTGRAENKGRHKR